MGKRGKTYIHFYKNETDSWYFLKYAKQSSFILYIPYLEERMPKRTITILRSKNYSQHENTLGNPESVGIFREFSASIYRPIFIYKLATLKKFGIQVQWSVVSHREKISYLTEEQTVIIELGPIILVVTS